MKSADFWCWWGKWFTMLPLSCGNIKHCDFSDWQTFQHFNPFRQGLHLLWSCTKSHSLRCTCSRSGNFIFHLPCAHCYVFRKCFEGGNEVEWQPPACGFVSYSEELVGWSGAPRMAMTHGKCFGRSQHIPWPLDQLFLTTHYVVTLHTTWWEVPFPSSGNHMGY